MRREAIDEGRRWIDQASEDLKWAKDLAERGGYHIACFLAQRVGEKALKAFLYSRGEEIVIGHSVERLSHQAARYDHEFDTMISVWSILDQFTFPPDIRMGFLIVFLPGSTQNMQPFRRSRWRMRSFCS